MLAASWWDGPSSLGPRNAELMPWQLAELYGEVNGSAWSRRRGYAKAAYPTIEFPTVLTGGRARYTAPDPVPTPPELTPEDAAEADLAAHEVHQREKDAKQRYKALLREESVYRKLVALGSETLAPLTPVCPAPRLSRPTKVIRQGMVLNFADWHLDEIVDEAIMEGLNVYNPPVALRRIECAVDKTVLISHLSERVEFGTLYVHCFGDFLTNVLRAGFDHIDALATAAMMPMKGARFAATLLAYALRDLAPNFPSVKVRCVIGNHGRNTKSMPYQLPTENLDWLVYQWAKTLTADLHNVEWEIPEAWSLTCDVEGWGFFLNHGYSDAKGGFGGISWYSLVKSDTKRTALDTKLNRKVLVRQYGHLHQEADVGRAGGNGRIRIEPSLMGGNAYAKEGMAGTYDEPGQSLLEVHAEEGLVAERSLNIRQYDRAEKCRYDGLLELL